MLKTCKDKIKLEALGKIPQNYEGIKSEISIFEQKRVKIDDFNEAEEKEIKEPVEKRKMNRREVTENNNLLRKEKKQEEDTKKEAEMLTRLRELKNEFENIKPHKKIRN